MVLKDQAKNYARKLVEDRPDMAALKRLVRTRRPLAMMFRDDGIVPNNPHLPVLVYRRVLAPENKTYGLATVIDALFENNGWGHSWRDTVYDFVHYHSQVHEVMGVARGSAKIECGGIKGRVLKVKAGDVLVLPAGTGHRLIESSRNFQVVGAYPREGSYDECTDSRDRPDAVKRIAKVPEAKTDPLYGSTGPLSKLWRKRA